MRQLIPIALLMAVHSIAVVSTASSCISADDPLLGLVLDADGDRFVLDPGPSLRAGVYFVQLSQGGQMRRAKLTLIR